MNFLKKNWIFVALGAVSLLLGILAILTAIKLQQEEPVAPTAPEKSKALEGDPVPACQLTFTLSLASPSPSPSGSPGTSPSPSPSGSPGPSPSPSTSPNPSPSPSSSPNPSPSSSPGTSPSPSPVLSCNNSCSINSDCGSGLVCSGGVCRNTSCTTKTNCICDLAQAAPKATVIPTVPVAGNSWPTIFLIMGGVALLVIGFALP